MIGLSFHQERIQTLEHRLSMTHDDGLGAAVERWVPGSIYGALISSEWPEGFSPDALAEGASELVEIEPLGRGGFGHVACVAHGDDTFAVKRVASDNVGVSLSCRHYDVGDMVMRKCGVI